MRSVNAEEDPRLAARTVRRVALRYRGGADPALDRPAHVRAASGLCWWRGRLAVVSDDVSFAGVVDPASGLTEPITLPHAPGDRRQFDTARGNKPDKLDLECAFAAGGRLYGLGSDSGLAVRRHVLVIDDGVVRLVALPRLYAALHQPAPGQGQLNLEAAALLGDRVIVGNRGGDVGADGVATRDAVAALPLAALDALLDDPDGAPLPAVAWQPLALGTLDGAALHLTELEPWPAAGPDGLLFAATAEATTSAYDDGAVTGSVVGVIAGGRARWARVTDERGAPLAAKLEGLAATPTGDRVLGAVDADDPERPSELLELALLGPW